MKVMCNMCNQEAKYSYTEMGESVYKCPECKFEGTSGQFKNHKSKRNLKTKRPNMNTQKLERSYKSSKEHRDYKYEERD